MAKRIEHYPGEILNSIGSIYIKEVPPPEGQVGRHALVECGICHKTHIQKLCNVINGNCACSECKLQRNREQVYKNRANHYSCGDILNEKTGSIFIKEVSHEGYAKRRGIVKCGRCGHIYEAAISNVVNGSYCSKCSDTHNSNASRAIENILQKNKIPYKREYTFKNLTVEKKRRLRFDFAIFLDNNYILLIEVDGQQHFEPVSYWGGEESFNRLKINDSRKNNYVNEHSNLFLVRIPYTQFNDIDESFILKIYNKYQKFILNT